METNKFKYQHVMLIDDLELDNFINEKLLAANNFSKKIYVTTSARSALEFLNNILIMGEEFLNAMPEVIFIDINMPMVDGFQFIEAFKKTIEKQLNKPKLVVLTSSVFEKDKEKTFSISEDIVFLNKPLTKEMLETL